MFEVFDVFLRPAFAVASVVYLGLGVRVARSSPRHANSVIALFLVLIGVFVGGAAFSHGTTDATLFGIGRTLTLAASGFLPVAFYAIYREYSAGPPHPLLIALLSLIPAATTVLALTNPWHNMIWSVEGVGAASHFSALTDHYWYSRIHMPFMYGLTGFSLFALMARLPSIAPAHRKTVIIVIGGALLPVAVDLANDAFGFGPDDFPYTAASFVFLLPALSYAAVTLRFHDFTPFDYKTLFDHVRDPIIVVDSAQCIVCANKSAQKLLGAPEKNLIGQHLWKDFAEARRLLAQARELDLTQTLHMDKDTVYELSVRPLIGRRGQNLGMVVLCRDVTERRNAQQRLAESELLIRTLIETSSNGILRFARSRDDGHRFRCIFANRAAEAFLGNGGGTLVGMPLEKIVDLHPDELIAHFDRHDDDSSISLETEMECADGERWLRIVGEPVGDDFSVTLVDITQRKHNENKMMADALRDPLTGVLNRRGFEIEGAERLGKHGRGAVMYLDLNQFKSINDRFGHQAGDALLKAFGHRLEFCLRPEDVLGRLGGDEFAIVLPGIGIEDAKHVALRLVQTAQEAYIIQGQEIKCTASVGISLMPKHGEELWQLISIADQAMYNAKAVDDEEAANEPAAYVEAATAG